MFLLAGRLLILAAPLMFIWGASLVLGIRARANQVEEGPGHISLGPGPSLLALIHELRIKVVLGSSR